jgi:uncharacterized protein (DUF1501 family)
MKRRTFIKYSSLAGSLPLATGLLSESAQAGQGRNVSPGRKRIVVLVELLGGNDGLNTLIPFTDPLYYKLRPTIAIPRKSMLPITHSLAMHPSLRPLQSYWQRKEMAWIQGVGYPRSNRSHFRAKDIWDSASNYNQKIDQGWVANLLGASHDIAGVAVNSDLGPLLGDHINSLKINDIAAFVRSNQHLQARSSNSSNNSLTHLLKTERIVAESTSILKQSLLRAHDPSRNFPRHSFGKELASIAHLINSGVDIPVYKITLGNFDTHAMQSHQHTRLLKMLAESLHAFAQNMKRSGQWNNVILMTYSEFGRQVAENGSQGTDHGEAAAHLVMGGRVRGGIYGKNPDLSRLSKNALRHSVDFRSVYGTVASRWWGLRNPWNRPLVPFV